MGRYLTRWLIPLPAILFAVAPQNANATAVPPNPYYNAPQNLIIESAADNGITVKWDVPPVSNYHQIDIYVVEFYKLTNGVESGGWAVWTESENHAYTFGSWIFQYTGNNLRFKVKAGSDACVGRPDPVGYCLYGAKASIDSDGSISSPTTTTTSSSTTTLPIQSSTTTSTTLAPTTTQTTTTTTLPATTTTTTEAPYVPSQTTTTTEPEETITTEPLEEATTTTTEPLEETSTTYPDGPVEDIVEPDETTIPETTVPEIFDESVVVDTTQPQEEEMLLEDTPDTTVLEEEVSLSDIISDEQFEEILDNLEDASPEQVATIIESILAADITSEQATELVSNVAVLQVISEEDAEQLFSEVVPADLTEEQAALIVEAVQTAPIEVRQAFEGVIDIFGSQFENYVPTGSNIPVSTRRTLVAIGATLTMLPTSRVKR